LPDIVSLALEFVTLVPFKTSDISSAEIGAKNAMARIVTIKVTKIFCTHPPPYISLIDMLFQYIKLVMHYFLKNTDQNPNVAIITNLNPSISFFVIIVTRAFFIN
jgi:hypothetical protein